MTLNCQCSVNTKMCTLHKNNEGCIGDKLKLLNNIAKAICEGNSSMETEFMILYSNLRKYEHKLNYNSPSVSVKNTVIGKINEAPPAGVIVHKDYLNAYCNIVCGYCNVECHGYLACNQRLNLCFRCKSDSHKVSNCPKPKIAYGRFTPKFIKDGAAGCKTYNQPTKIEIGVTKPVVSVNKAKNSVNNNLSVSNNACMKSCRPKTIKSSINTAGSEKLGSTADAVKVNKVNINKTMSVENKGRTSPIKINTSTMPDSVSCSSNTNVACNIKENCSDSLGNLVTNELNIDSVNEINSNIVLCDSDLICNNPCKLISNSEKTNVESENHTNAYCINLCEIDASERKSLRRLSDNIFKNNKVSPSVVSLNTKVNKVRTKKLKHKVFGNIYSVNKVKKIKKILKNVKLIHDSNNAGCKTVRKLRSFKRKIVRRGRRKIIWKHVKQSNKKTIEVLQYECIREAPIVIDSQHMENSVEVTSQLQNEVVLEDPEVLKYADAEDERELADYCVTCVSEEEFISDAETYEQFIRAVEVLFYQGRVDLVEEIHEAVKQNYPAEIVKKVTSDINRISGDINVKLEKFNPFATNNANGTLNNVYSDNDDDYFKFPGFIDFNNASDDSVNAFSNSQNNFNNYYAGPQSVNFTPHMGTGPSQWLAGPGYCNASYGSANQSSQYLPVVNNNMPWYGSGIPVQNQGMPYQQMPYNNAQY